jgi:DNA-directed RNA polymerase subunit RPC12/RpoP
MRNPRTRVLSQRTAKRPQAGRQFDRLTATELYCPKCGRSMPVRERLLLVLPEGDKYEYLCMRCGTSVGDRIDKGPAQPLLIV